MPDIIKTIGLGRLAAIGAILAAVAGFFFWLLTAATTAPMTVLFNGLDPRSSAEIIARLEQMNVPYELKGDGSIIMAPEDRALKLRMQLAGDGLPQAGIGYELFDNQSAFGTTAFVQNVNKLRALEGELARTIRELDQISAARVHLTIPERKLFERDSSEPTASVVVRTRGQLPAANVRAIQHLVAAAVSRLAPDRVAVIDEAGRLLGGGAGDETAAAIAAGHQERNAQFEERLRRQVESIVESVVGPGRVRVQVAAEMDFSRVTSNSEIFDPDGQVVRSTQSVSEAQDETDNTGREGVSVGNALPGDAATAEQAAAGSRATTQRTEETVNYEISRTTRVETQEAGRVKRMSVAVAVDGVTSFAADGTPSYAPRPDEEMAKIRSLVSTAIGFDETRGDKLEVINLRFATIDGLPEPGESTDILGFSPAQIARMAEVGLLALIGLLVALFVLRPLVKAVIAPPAGPGGLAQIGGGAAAGTAGGQAQLTADGGIAGALPAPDHGEPDDGAMIDLAQVDGQVKASSVKKLGEVVTRHPDEALALVRTWLHEPA